MEEPNATTEVSSVRDACAESRNSVHECSCGSNREPSLSMPVCFLVKEQAKSYIAIQELQKRLDQVEGIQDDVVDAIIEFRNYLSDTKSFSSVNNHLTPSSLNNTRSPATIFSKLTVQKSSENIVPSALESSVEVPSSILKTKSYSSKDCDHMFNELERLQANVTSQEHSHKNFDLIKSKESVLESDKQDSGLDSDCREHNDIHPSIHKNIPSLLCPESNDELLQLLDEINDRSTILQKQLTVTEEVSPLAELKGMSAASKSNDARGNENHESKFRIPGNGFVHRDFSKSNPATIETRGLYDEQNVSAAFRHSSSGLVGLFEAKPVSSKVSVRKRAINSIDSATVSAILKETNVVDLQRQALIYLVDNAVLHTKLKEAEQKLSSKNLENERVENSLKEESRLLMMENRELRLSLDEQRMESRNMKSRVLMLEKALQSVTHENQELTWQLGESLNLHTLAKRGLHNYSPSFVCENQVNTKSGRRASMPPRLPCQSEANVSCVKSKLLSNTSSFLDITMEDADDVPHQAASNNAALKCQNGPLHSSTPMPSSQKQKAFKLCMNASQEVSASPVNFHSVKKCLKPGYDVSKNQRYLEEAHCRSGQDPCVKTLNVPRNMSGEASPLENVSNFPFNTILEKLKSNSEYRLSKSASATSGRLLGSNSDNQTSASLSKVKASALQDGEAYSHPKENKSLQGNGSDALSRKKGRNIQQRIQNILDRIVAESEEAS